MRRSDLADVLKPTAAVTANECSGSVRWNMFRGFVPADFAAQMCFALFGMLPGLVIAKTALAGPMLWQLRRRGPGSMRVANVMFSAVASWNVGILIAQTLNVI